MVGECTHTGHLFGVRTSPTMIGYFIFW